MFDENKKHLESQLWNIANELRGKMDADEFRDYILGFIFYKYLSEKMNIYANNLLKEDKITYKEIDENSSNGKEYLDIIEKEAIETLGYFLKPKQLFSSIAQRNNVSIEELEKTLNNIESSTMGSESEDDFGNLFEDLDLNSTKLGKTVDDRERLITKIINHLDKIDFEIENIESDILGDAYEYLIAQFASGAGKKAGEFYTPQAVSKVLAKIVSTNKGKLKSVYDPTCGSGSLLLRVAKEAVDVSYYYGQESIRTTYNLARMNMIMHNVHYQKFDIKQDDTLENPMHLDKKFEAIVANPPFSQNWSASELFTSDERFSEYGKLAPKSRADYAFVQHMIYHLADNGTIAVILPHGVLYRGNSENHILKHIISKNYLDAVISLPDNLFYKTTTPTLIMVIKKNRVNKNDILFIDASKEFTKITNQNILEDYHIDKIIKIYRNREEVSKYSRKVGFEEIKENNFNLNFPRYIDNFKRTADVNLKYVSEFLRKIQTQSKEIEKKIINYCEELSIPSPEGNNTELLQLFKLGVTQKIFKKNISFKNSKSSAFSKWRQMTLGDIFIYKPTNSLSRDKLNYENGDVMNIHYGDIHKKFNILFDASEEEVPLINPEIDISKIPLDYYCKDGDIIIADASEDYEGIGRAIEVTNTNGKKILGGLHTIIARPNKINLVKGFLAYLMTTEEVRLQIMRLSHRSKVLGISSKMISEVVVQIPEFDEQKKIVEFLKAIDNKIYFNNYHKNEIKKYNESLIQE